MVGETSVKMRLIEEEAPLIEEINEGETAEGPITPHYMYTPSTNRFDPNRPRSRINKPHSGCKRLVDVRKEYVRGVEKAQNDLRLALQNVKKHIGWEMPGGDLMLMLVKKKIPLEIIKVMLDHGLQTMPMSRRWYPSVQPSAESLAEDVDYALTELIDGRGGRTAPPYPANDAPINVHEAAGEALDRSIAEVGWGEYEGDGVCYCIETTKEDQPEALMDWGWVIMRWKQTGQIHFTIKQYLDEARRKENIEDAKYYQTLLLLIFTRHFRKIEGGNSMAGFNMEDPLTINTDVYYDHYRTLFPRLTHLAESSITHMNNILEHKKTEEKGAENIQRSFRGWKGRKKYKELDTEHARKRVARERSQPDEVMVDSWGGNRKKTRNRRRNNKKRARRRKKTRRKRR